MKPTLLLLCCSAAFGQFLSPWPGPLNGTFGFPPVSLGVHAGTDNGASSASTVAVSLGTPTTGDTIICEYKSPSTNTLLYIADNVNSGSYNLVQAQVSAATPGASGLAYKYNAAASSTTVTANFTSSSTTLAMSCSAWHSVQLGHAVDAQFYTKITNTTGTNPHVTSRTPAVAGELVFGILPTNGAATPTAGTNFTLLDSQTASFLWPEYWIQTTPTATTTPYVAASSVYNEGAAAFVPNTGTPFCDSDIIVDWSGGSNGSTVTTGLLGQGIYPTATGTYGNGLWYLTSATGVTFDSGQAGTLSTSENCPFFTGVGAGTLGVSYATSGGSTQVAKLVFGNTYQNEPGLAGGDTTAAVCFVSHIPNTITAGVNDPIGIYGVSGTGYDYIELNLQYSSGHWTFGLEAKSAGSPSRYNITPETMYWISMTYAHNPASTNTHTLRIYTCANQVQGQPCGANPTLVNTITNTGVTNNVSPNYLHIGPEAMTTVTGYGWSYCSPLKVCYDYGCGALLP